MSRVALRRVVRAVSALLLALGAVGLGSPALATDGPRVVVGRIEGAINPVTARYVDRLVTNAERTGATAVVLGIQTPGGLVNSTYAITGRLLNARVPVITWVSPSGAHAASAGTFITLAGHVAVMAPATVIGAAHPVGASGGDIQGDLRTKAENDAAEQIRQIALARGRDATWAEEAVRKSASLGADDAVRRNVVDFVARDLPELLRLAEGRRVSVAGSAATLALGGLAVDEDPPTPLEDLLHLLVDPQVAVLLFTLGTYGLIFELSNPSLIFPGIAGVIAIVLALFAFGTLDASASGLALMLFAVVLFVLEAKLAGHGLLLAGGLVALALGAIIVLPPGRPTFPGVRAAVDPLLIVAIVGSSGLFAALLARASASYLHLPTRAAAIPGVGALGHARTVVDGGGVVSITGEDWSAAAAGAPIAAGAAIRVRAVDGLRVIVEPAEEGEAPG